MKPLLCAAVVLLSASAEAQNFSASREKWEECVFAKVDDFNTSARSASDIATAALGSCLQQEALAKRDFTSVFKDKTFDDFRRELFEKAVARIVSSG